MKTTFTLSALLLTLVLMAFTYGMTYQESSKNTSGANPGFSNDPAGGNMSCAVCHSHYPTAYEAGWITSNIPAAGYEPLITYTITATAIGAGNQKFGFQVSPQDSLGNFQGVLINTSTMTQLTSNPNYITHTATGTAGTDSISWSFDWEAPEANSGEVIFFGAFNIANNDNMTSGDYIKLSTLVVNEKDPSTFTHERINDPMQNIYPNPATDVINISVSEFMSGSVYSIYDINGRVVKTGELKNVTHQVDINHLTNGVYFYRNDTHPEVITFIKR